MSGPNALDRVPAWSIAVASSHRSARAWPLLAFLVVALLAQPWHGGIDVIGLVFALLSGACWVLYTVLTQRVGDRCAGISELSLTIPVAAVVIAAGASAQRCSRRIPTPSPRPDETLIAKETT